MQGRIAGQVLVVLERRGDAREGAGDGRSDVEVAYDRVELVVHGCQASPRSIAQFTRGDLAAPQAVLQFHDIVRAESVVASGVDRGHPATVVAGAAGPARCPVGIT